MPGKIQNPSEIYHEFWLYCYDKELAQSFIHSDGKWMVNLVFD